MITIAVVAAAGQGTRMKHLTKNKPKHLLRVNGRPFLAYLLDNLLKAGYREIIIVTGYKGELIDQFISHYKAPEKQKSKFNISSVNQHEYDRGKYGTACPLMAVRHLIKNRPFVFVAGDNLYSPGDLKAMAKDDKYSWVGGIYNDHPEKYGVLVGKGAFLEEIKEKPQQFFGNIINTAVYKFNNVVFDKLGKIKKSPRGEYELTDVVTLLARERKVKVLRLKDFWKDFGNPGDIRRLSDFLTKSKIR